MQILHLLDKKMKKSRFISCANFSTAPQTRCNLPYELQWYTYEVHRNEYERSSSYTISQMWYKVLTNEWREPKSEIQTIWTKMNTPHAILVVVKVAKSPAARYQWDNIYIYILSEISASTHFMASSAQRNGQCKENVVGRTSCWTLWNAEYSNYWYTVFSNKMYVAIWMMRCSILKYETSHWRYKLKNRCQVSRLTNDITWVCYSSNGR